MHQFFFRRRAKYELSGLFQKIKDGLDDPQIRKPMDKLALNVDSFLNWVTVISLKGEDLYVLILVEHH